MDCIDTYYNPVKNMTISDAEQQIEYGQRLREIVENPGNRVMYYLLDGPKRGFVSEELMLIPDDTEFPPDYVQEW